jgi:hypothetical protein
MIEQAVEELTPVVGTRPACRALGVAPATIHRRRRPTRGEACEAEDQAGTGAVCGRTRGGARDVAL